MQVKEGKDGGEIKGQRATRDGGKLGGGGRGGGIRDTYISHSDFQLIKRDGRA